MRMPFGDAHRATVTVYAISRQLGPSGRQLFGFLAFPSTFFPVYLEYHTFPLPIQLIVLVITRNNWKCYNDIGFQCVAVTVGRPRGSNSWTARCTDKGVTARRRANIPLLKGHICGI